VADAHFDIAIVGGGLAGLALAQELAAPAHRHLRVCVLERRATYRRDRTWSFWAPDAALEAGGELASLAPLVRASWARWRVRFDDRVQDCAVPGWAFHSIDADRFYDAALGAIGAASNIDLRLGVEVGAIAAGTPCSVPLRGGGAVRAGLVFDARPPAPAARPGALAQQFMGWEIELDESGKFGEPDADNFDPSFADLMDFAAAPDSLHFRYVLPYGPRRALVESTWVGPPHLHTDYAAQLERYIAERWPGRAWRRVFEERGVLGLEPVPARASGGPVLALGRGAGTLRPSTGFAFLETLGHTRRVAAALREATPGSAERWAEIAARLPAFRRPWPDRAMDLIFMRALRGDWPGAPALFVELFAHTPGARLLRFLTGQASLLDRLATMRSLPVPALTHALWRARAPIEPQAARGALP
jgi:lycopene beta-cyclase